MRVAIAILMLGSHVAAAAAGLGEIYQLARENDSQFAAARETYNAGKEKLAQALALWRPSATLSANVRGNRDHSNQNDISSSYGSSSATLTMVQSFVNLPKVQNLRQGELQVALAEQAFLQAEQDLMLRVAKAYFDAVQAEEVLAAVGAQKQAFSEQVAATRRGLEVGTTAITDVNEAQTRYDLTLALEIAARNDVEVRRRVLERIILREAPPLARFDPERHLEVPPAAELSALTERAADEGLPVVVARLSRELAQREAKKQAYGAMPMVDATLSVNDSHSVATPGSIQRYNTRQGYVGLELTWPFLQGGAVSSREREAAANLAKAGYDLESAQRQAVLDTRQAWLNAASGAAQVKALELALASGETQVRSTRRGLEVGVRTRLDVLNAEQLLYATRRDLANARYQTLMAGLQLKAAANRLVEDDLKAIDAWLK
jgi:outer membrane protein